MAEQPRTRPWVIVVGVMGVLVGIGWSAVRYVQQPDSLPMKDFVQYWSAARVNLAGGNPYEAEQLRPHQEQALGETNLTAVTMMWNPPWILAVLTPLGLLPAKFAHLFFLAVQLGCLLLSASWLWSIYRGPTDSLWVAWLATLVFGPTAFIFWYGQIGGVILLGITGFLYFRLRNRPLTAGAFAALTAVKPHLLFAFGLVLLLEAIISKAGRRVVLAGAGTVGLAAGIAWLLNPQVYAHYSSAGWESSTAINTSPKDWEQPLVSYWIRMAIDPQRFWIQFVPMTVAVLGVLVYWWQKRTNWHWSRELPRLIFVSLLAGAYGAWIFDLVVLLVPVLAVWANRVSVPGPRRWLAAVGHLLITLAILPIYLPTSATGEPVVVGLNTFIWVTPAVLVWYLFAGGSSRNQSINDSGLATRIDFCFDDSDPSNGAPAPRPSPTSSAR